MDALMVNGLVVRPEDQSMWRSVFGWVALLVDYWSASWWVVAIVVLDGYPMAKWVVVD